MKHRIPLLLVASALTLSACAQTFEGIKQDFSTLGTAIDSKMTTMTTKNEDGTKDVVEGAPQSLTTAASLDDGTCPPIVIDPKLDSMAEFEDMTKPSENTEVSHVKITSTQTECSVKDGNLELRVDVTFASELGPKAKRKEGDQPFFAYPYFVAVADGNAAKLAEELFAATFTYAKDQDRKELVETIRQRLPLNDDGSVPAYQIHIGFQLTDEQMAYNAAK